MQGRLRLASGPGLNSYCLPKGPVASFCREIHVSMLSSEGADREQPRVGAPPQVAKRARGRMFDNERTPQWAKDLIWQCFLSSLQGSSLADSYQGFASPPAVARPSLAIL